MMRSKVYSVWLAVTLALCATPAFAMPFSGQVIRSVSVSDPDFHAIVCQANDRCWINPQDHLTANIKSRQLVWAVRLGTQYVVVANHGGTTPWSDVSVYNALTHEHELPADPRTINFVEQAKALHDEHPQGGGVESWPVPPLP